MYCGTAQVRNLPLFRDAGKIRTHPEEQAGRVYEIHDTTEFEWGCYVGRDSGNSSGGDDHRRIPAGPHEWSPVSDSDAGDSIPEAIQPLQNTDHIQPQAQISKPLIDNVQPDHSDCSTNNHTGCSGSLISLCR